jgi:alkyldihydroxyacetonephosphate synthase
MLSDSFETSVPWDRLLLLISNVMRAVDVECKGNKSTNFHQKASIPIFNSNFADKGIKHFSSSSRVTQVYDTGACVYFYFAMNAAGVTNALSIYEDIESRARDEAIASGGNISHHHGVGQKKRRWVPKQISPTAVSLYRAVKNELDPKNIFAVGNIILPENRSHL